MPPKREQLGVVVAGCELRELPATGGRRHHYFTAVLRDLTGNLWACGDQHSDPAEAQSCARREYERRVGTGQIRASNRRPR